MECNLDPQSALDISPKAVGTTFLREKSLEKKGNGLEKVFLGVCVCVLVYPAIGV
jgi:hypothetical protein